MSTATTVDWIVVGGGSAGCVVAGRLAAQSGARVLLIEAGAARQPKEVGIPAAWPKLFGTRVDWALRTEPQRHLGGREVYFPRGRGLGGSSALNAQIWLHGHPADFDEWADDGNDGWSYASLRTYLGRAESASAGTGTRGRDGPLHVNADYTPNPLSAAFVAVATGFGLPRRGDFNGEELMGAGYCEHSRRRGRRHDTATAYLPRFTPFRGDDRALPAGLHVASDAVVQRVVIERGRAVGVEFVRDGKPHVVHADAEVVLCAGAVHSPHVLMLSGIGPARELGPLGIDVHVDLPGVGANLHDHPVVPLTYTCDAPVSLFAAESLGNIAKYLLLRRGMLATGGVEALAHLDSTAGWRSRAGAPDLQLLMVNALWTDEGLAPPPRHGFAIAVAALKPASRGRIALRSADPRVAPAIDPNYLDDPADREVIHRGVQLARELAASSAFADLNPRAQEPGAGPLDRARTDAFVARRLQSYYHPVGSCRMGRDALAVVDATLRVHGVDRLRVIDASIMPVVPRANTNAATIAIAEKGVDLLLARAVLASAPTRVHGLTRAAA